MKRSKFTLRNIASVIVSMLVIVGFILTMWFPSGRRVESAPAYFGSNSRCIDAHTPSSYIVRPLVSFDRNITGKAILTSAGDNLKEFIVIDFDEKTQADYLCPSYKVPVGIRSVHFTTKGDVLATSYDKKSIYLFPESNMNVVPTVFEIPTIGKRNNFNANLHTIPDSTGNRFWVLHFFDNGPTYVHLFDIDSGILNTTKFDGVYVLGGILDNAIVLKGSAGVSVLETNGTVTDLVSCPNINRCIDIVAAHGRFVAGIEFLSIESYKSDGNHKYPLYEISFGDLLVFDIDTGKQYTIDKPSSGSWYTNPLYVLERDYPTDIIHSNKFVMEFETSTGPGWRENKFVMDFETSTGPGWREWSQYIIDISDQTTQFLRDGTGINHHHLRLHGTVDSQFLMFVHYKRTLYMIDQKDGSRISIITLPDELRHFNIGDIL